MLMPLSGEIRTLKEAYLFVYFFDTDAWQVRWQVTWLLRYKICASKYVQQLRNRFEVAANFKL